MSAGATLIFNLIITVLAIIVATVLVVEDLRRMDSPFRGVFSLLVILVCSGGIALVWVTWAAMAAGTQ